uniref:ATP-dependent DNA helicase n=1 Tax=Tanacetum cinerariifolium TaxID=118510 RepID=A0A6L2MHH2_TANCI|nr:hypothetical protein [Tanacetum cinerariifolium]
MDLNDLVAGLSKFKYHKEHLFPSCEQGKSKRASHPPKPVPNSRQILHLLHMDLCGPMRIASINGQRYVLVIVDDYSRYTWVYFLRSKDEAPAVIITFLKRITVLLQSPVIIIRTDNDTEFNNQVLKEYFDIVAISHQMSFVRTPQQNGVVERRNRNYWENCSPAQESQVRQSSTASTTIADTAPTPINSSSLATNIPITLQDVDELNSNAMVDGNMITLEQVIGEPSQPILTRNQLRSDGDICMYALSVSTMEPKNVKEAMTDPAWIDSIQEELLHFKRLDVWVLVPAPNNISPLTLKWLLKNKHDEEQTVIQICLWYVNSGCSKHMTRNLKLLINFVWKFMGTVCFRNDHVVAILGFGDLQWGHILITRVYFVEGLGHNLFSVGQFCDSDLEVAFKRNACFVRNLEGVDLLKADRSTNFYTINLHEMASASPICLMAQASSTKNDLVAGLSKFKYHKEHLFPSCEQGKSKRASHPPKPVPNSRQRLHLLHMDLCGPMRIASINGKRITVLLQSPVIIIRTDNDTEFNNQVLKEYFDIVAISHQMSFVRTPQQNGVVERRNRTLVEAPRTMLIFSHAPLFLWAEAIATACFTQNSIIYRRLNKTSYELINGKKPDISFLHVFGALCYPKNDREDIGKLSAKGDIGFFIGYSADSCAYRIYNRRTKKIMETMNVSFDELSAIAFEQRSSKPGLQCMTSGQISSGLDLTYAPSTITTQQPSEGKLDLLFEAMYDNYIGSQPSATGRTVRLLKNLKFDVDELNSNAMVDGNMFVNPFANSSTSATASSLPQNVDPSNMHTFYQPYPHEFQWTKDHSRTSKTFMWKAITSALRLEEQTVLAVASSGIASLLLPADEAIPHGNDGCETELLYPKEYLNSLKFTGLPPHRLELIVALQLNPTSTMHYYLNPDLPEANYILSVYCFKAIIDDETAIATLTCFSLKAHTFVPDCNMILASAEDKDTYHVPIALMQAEGQTYIFQYRFGKKAKLGYPNFTLDAVLKIIAPTPLALPPAYTTASPTAEVLELPSSSKKGYTRYCIIIRSY